MSATSKVQNELSPPQGELPAAGRHPLMLGSGLKVSDLRKSFTSPLGDKVDVLRGIDFEATPGEMVAITGPSGSGKSTLLHLIGGLEDFDHGSISLDEIELGSLRRFEQATFRRRNFGFVFQFHHLLGDLTAVENVALPLMIARRPTPDAFRRAAAMLQELGLADKGVLPAGHLSGGEQQKVALGRALIGEPAVILADEPTGNLDGAQGEEIAGLLRNYCHRRQAIAIVATHNQELGQNCDRILAIRDGRLRTEFTPASEKTGLLRL
jgi:ABC-type lipoprotein export system ATPase subunit